MLALVFFLERPDGDAELTYSVRRPSQADLNPIYINHEFAGYVAGETGDSPLHVPARLLRRGHNDIEISVGWVSVDENGSEADDFYISDICIEE